jgi:16S rRNA processing protein RimM
MGATYRQIGKLVATHGLKGELILQHSLGKKTDFKGVEALFVEMRKDDLLPYFLCKATAKTDQESWLLLEEIDTKEKAKLLTPKPVWVTEEVFLQLADHQAPISLLGYQMWEGDQLIGEVKSVIEQPHQVLCAIDFEGNEALIPLHAETLVKVDAKARKVHVQLPEGLLDLYR